MNTLIVHKDDEISLLDQGYIKAESIVLHSLGVVLTTKRFPDIPWKEDGNCGPDLNILFSTVISFLEKVGIYIDPQQRRELASDWTIAYPKYDIFNPTEIFFKHENGALKLALFYPTDQCPTHSWHNGAHDIFGLDCVK